MWARLPEKRGYPGTAVKKKKRKKKVIILVEMSTKTKLHYIKYSSKRRSESKSVRRRIECNKARKALITRQ